MTNLHTKECTKCRLVLPLNMFYKRGNSHIAECKACTGRRHKKWNQDNKVQRAITKRNWYARNKNNQLSAEKRKARKKERENDIKVAVRTLKDGKPCGNCKKQFEYFIMDWNHLGNKRWNISEMVRRGHSLKSIKIEIGKCELLCANCHRIRTVLPENKSNPKRLFVDVIKSMPCTDCNLNWPSHVMDFDHRDQSIKIATISRMVNDHRYSITDVETEISKCDLVCANCHRRRTFRRK